ncbi:tryptophan synthase subunit beta [Salicibibacter halophilus]|uniref:Tryptophan synthase beta chain n=1 Tax=Salicibibacter halophilus TaxID=2502791 RepID=A0A514LFD7_9BACI|nr:tryptophan synthase subunit beta [Salicibibacter halophilus]QDI89961.1 tryptophan synthase subunit beta [Salicibibacter halophilus]
MAMSYPDARGRYGEFGGKYVPETVMAALEELEAGFQEALADPAFMENYEEVLQTYAGRTTPLTYADRLSRHVGGAEIYLKREDLLHTGAHKINNAIGQALLAVRMGKKKIVAETGAGQHGVATATAAAKYGLECKIFMGAKDMKRQRLNVFRMELLGAEVVPATSGSETLKDATNEAIRYWVANVDDTMYLIGSVVGPHPYPKIVREFQRIIGKEAKAQMEETPAAVIACVGGGSNAMGIFSAFLADEQVQLYGAEAAGHGIITNEHAASLSKGSPGVIHGALTYLLQDEAGQISEPYSISAGLDYPGIGPEHAHLSESGRVNYEPISDDEAMEALVLLTKTEGILPALESAHALALAMKKAKRMQSTEKILVCLSGRGDKDVETISNVQKGKEDIDE